MISGALFQIVRCPDCGGEIKAAPKPGAVSESRGRAAAYESPQCAGCGRMFDTTGSVLDLRPREAFTEQTKYLDEALHKDARHESISPPLLGSKIRHDMLRRLLRPGPGDRALDLGCGSGRTLSWTAESGAALTGADIAPYFAPEARDHFDVVLADLRRLPFRDAVFNKAWSLDVLEHLSRPALLSMLAEANRVLTDGGVLFVYSHVRQNGWPAAGVRAVNKLAHLLERNGLIDLKQERLRKSDHVNPLNDHDDLARVVERCGFRIEHVTYYTPVIGAFVENVLVRMAERWLVRRALTGGGASAAEASRMARSAGKTSVQRRGATYAVLRGLSALMRTDIWLFGLIPSGPFFALLKKERPAAPDTPR
jgi:ubiquinone/menaquinone biosynthesis C-methylase UbiE